MGQSTPRVLQGKRELKVYFKVLIRCFSTYSVFRYPFPFLFFHFYLAKNFVFLRGEHTLSFN